MRRKCIFLVLICAVAILVSACAKQEEKKPSRYGFRQYFKTGDDRVLIEEFEVNGNVRTSKTYNTDGKWMKTHTITYNTKTGNKAAETEEYPESCYETEYDNLGRKATEIRRNVGNAGAEKTDSVSMPFDYFDYSWLGVCEDASFTNGDMPYLWDYRIDRPVDYWSCSDCVEMKTEYTYQGDSELPKTMTTVSDTGSYSAFVERGDGDIVLSACVITDNIRFEENYDPETSRGVAKWQFHAMDSSEIFTIEGEKLYDADGRLVHALVDGYNAQYELTVVYSTSGNTVTETERHTYESEGILSSGLPTPGKTNVTEQNIFFYDSEQRLLRSEETEIREQIRGKDQWDVDVSEVRYESEYEYDEAGKTMQQYRVNAYTGERIRKCVYQYDPDGNEIFHQVYAIDDPMPGRLAEEYTETICEDPEICGRILCRTTTSYGFNEEIEYIETWNFVEMDTNGHDWRSEYHVDDTIWAAEDGLVWEEYRREVHFPSPEGGRDEVYTRGTFDSEGRLRTVENLYYTPKEILEYDEKGRQVAGGSAEGRIIWEYWENED